MEVDNNASNETLVYQRPIDYNLYQKLWSLQDYFCLPTQCFHQEKWKQFVLNVQEVLQAFSSYKLESISTKRRKKISKDIEEKMEVSQNTFSSSHFFAKYLTSDTLVNLQLSDSHFRRHIFIQLLILFQYLTSDIKFKTSSQNMSESQQQWVESTTQRVYELLEETPPDGKGFAEYIRIVLEREVTWINWKNQGCPSFEKNGNRPFSSNETDKRLGETIYQRKEEKDLGNKELSRLWNLCPDNLESCSSPERIFVPAMDIFLDEALEQTKPDCQVPKEDKIISNPNYRWQALRLLSRESTHFFPYANQSQIRPLDDYLENVIIQTCKEL
jgi:THO complex subunit 1